VLWDCSTEYSGETIVIVPVRAEDNVFASNIYPGGVETTVFVNANVIPRS
jgi:hypothetical protein